MSITAACRRLAATLLALATSAVCAQYSTPMRNVENPDRTPYQNAIYFTIDPPYLNNFGFFPTPAGSRYILEFVSISCVTPSATDVFPQVYLNVSRNVPSGTTGYAIPSVNMTRTGPAAFGGYVWGGSAMIKAFADPSPYDAGGGSAIYLNVFHSEPSLRASCSAAITGHSLAN